MSDARGYCETLEAKLLHLLYAHGIMAQPAGIEQHPLHARIYLALPINARFNKVLAMQKEIGVALHTRVTVGNNERGVYVDIPLPRQYHRAVMFSWLARRGLQKLSADRANAQALLGVSEGGTSVLMNLASPATPHVLVAGTTGSGKTNLLTAIILSLSLYNRPSDLQMFILDAKASSFPHLAGLPNVTSVSTGPQGWGKAVAYVALEMEERLKQEEVFEGMRLVLVIDELADLVRRCPELLGPLRSITEKGRSARCHLICATQKPSAKVLDTIITANIPLRLVGRVTSGAEAAVASGQPQTEAHKLPGKGAFLAVSGGNVSRFHAPLTRPLDVQIVQNIAGEPRERPVMVTRSAQVTSLLDKLKELLPKQGRPATPPPTSVIQWLVQNYHLGNGWPKNVEVMRRIAEAEGKKFVNATRVHAALDIARERVRGVAQ